MKDNILKQALEDIVAYAFNENPSYEEKKSVIILKLIAKSALIEYKEKLQSEQQEQWESKKDVAFVVEARKFGREAAHSYTVAVCDNLQLAKEIAEWHADHRGGKYGIKVYKYTKNIGTEALEKSNAELCVYEIKSPYADPKPSDKAVIIPNPPKN